MQPQNKPNDTGVTDCGKYLETGKRRNPLNTESVWKQGNNKILCISKNVTHAGHQQTLDTESVQKHENDKIP